MSDEQEPKQIKMYDILDLESKLAKCSANSTQDLSSSELNMPYCKMVKS